MVDKSTAEAAAAMEAARAQVDEAIAAKRKERDGVNADIEHLKQQARALTVEINALEDTLPAKKFTGRVTRLKT